MATVFRIVVAFKRFSLVMVILGIRNAVRVDGLVGYLDHPIGNSLTSLIRVMLWLAN